MDDIAPKCKRVFTEKDRIRNYHNRRGNFPRRLTCCLYERKAAARKRGLEFSVSIKDFEEQSHCKLLRGVSFCFFNERGKDDSLSVDRINPLLGYTKENTWLICSRANRIKNNATFEEFEEIYLNWKTEIEQRKKGE